MEATGGGFFRLPDGDPRVPMFYAVLASAPDRDAA
jgi:hypothetical protein